MHITCSADVVVPVGLEGSSRLSSNLSGTHKFIQHGQHLGEGHPKEW